jgi:putative transposase
VSQALSPAIGRPYGLARVARIWRLSRATLYRHRAMDDAAAPPRPVRRGPVGACSDAEPVGHIRAQILGSRLYGEGMARATARSGPACAMPAGIRTSARRVRRLMGRHGLLAPRRVGRPEQRAHDGTITTAAVDVMWGADMTETVTLAEGRARVFVAVDHCSGECVGSHAARSGNRFEALEPIRQGVLRHFGRIERDAAEGLALRHDHGSNYMSGDFQAELRFLGIESSPSFVREPEGNGVAERFIRTLKENFLWVHTFETIEDLRQELRDFVAHYNATWLVARHGYRTPDQVRADQRRVDRPNVANLPLAA